ncbi:hypothetical protein K438DRAFT_1996239 [Mycena galopus ATCC 62051]|nr:hypothetical protein K438DRAFT_1996239 [Mycena galopus ATCC 62051]
MTPAPSSPKKASHKKRHTKPCRYFQVGHCPHKEQEDCDFAHVYSDPRASLPPPKQCRYYLQGNCTNGIWCQYLHGQASAGSDDHSLLKDYQHMSSLSGGEFGATSNTVQMRVGVAPPAVYVPNHFNVVHAQPTPWQYPVELVPSPHLLPPNRIASPAASPAASPDYIDFSTSSSSPTSSVSDDDLPGQYCSYFTEPQPIGVSYLGPPYDDHIQPYSPQLSVVPTGYRIPPLYEILSPKTPPSASFYSAAGFPPHPQPSRTLIDRERQRLATYRTKPCRYIVAGTVCPNGEACTFIHSIPEKADEPLSSPESGKLRHDLPSKPLSTKEENTRKGYFPISWRVIGGGVLVGGTKGEASDDDSDLSDNSFESPVSRVLSVEISSSAPPHTIVFPPMDSDADSDDSATPTEIVRARTRASSIPSTPITLHVDHLRLFSAESPGGL